MEPRLESIGSLIRKTRRLGRKMGSVQTHACLVPGVQMDSRKAAVTEHAFDALLTDACLGY